MLTAFGEGNRNAGIGPGCDIPSVMSRDTTRGNRLVLVLVLGINPSPAPSPSFSSRALLRRSSIPASMRSLTDSALVFQFASIRFNSSSRALSALTRPTLSVLPTSTMRALRSSETGYRLSA